MKRFIFLILLGVSIFSIQSFADTRLSALPNNSSPTSSDLTYDVKSGTSYNITLSQIGTLLGVSNTNGTTSLQPNVGIGSTNAQNYLDIEGGGELIGNTWNVGVSTVSPTQLLNVNGNASFNGGISTATWTDPINDWHAAGVNTTTTSTGTNNSGQNLLTVASVSGWSVGMGIAVGNAGTGGNTELITTVTAINSLTFTLNTNIVTTITTGQTINHDDTLAITQAVQSGKNVHLRTGNYNVTSQITFNKPVILQGDGNLGRDTSTSIASTVATVIFNRGKTNDVLNLTSIDNISSDILLDFAIVQATGITPTAGNAINIGNISNTKYIFGCSFQRLTVFNTFGGLFIGYHVDQLHVNDVQVRVLGTASGSSALYYNDPSPAGDNWITNSQFASQSNAAPANQILQSDTNTFIDDKFQGGSNAMLITANGGNVQHLNFTGCSFENGDGVTDPLVLLSSPSGTLNDISFTGGEFGVNTGGHLMDLNAAATSQISITGNIFQTASFGIVVHGVTNVTIGNNVCDSLTTTGILVTSSSGTPSNISISNNSGCTVSNTAGISTIFYSLNNNVGIGTVSPPTNLFNTGNSALIGNVGIGSVNPGQALDVQGTLRLAKLGGTLAVASGTNGCQGQATLSGGTVTVSTTCTPTTSQGIFLQDATTGALTNVGTQTVGTVTSGTSFVINSTNVLDASTVNWFVIKSS